MWCQHAAPCYLGPELTGVQSQVCISCERREQGNAFSLGVAQSAAVESTVLGFGVFG